MFLLNWQILQTLHLVIDVHLQYQLFVLFTSIQTSLIVQKKENLQKHWPQGFSQSLRSIFFFFFCTSWQDFCTKTCWNNKYRTTSTHKNRELIKILTVGFFRLPDNKRKKLPVFFKPCLIKYLFFDYVAFQQKLPVDLFISNYDWCISLF